LARNEDIQKEGIQEAKKMIDETIDSVRRMSQDLMPATLQKFGLLQAVKEMCDQYASQAKIKIEYQQIGGEIHLDRAKEVMLFRIVQELLNNAIRHSQGSSIQVLFNTNSPVRIEVLDDGVGFDFSEKKQNATTIGLFTMFNRARMLEATLAYDVERSIGTKATLTIPWT
jgi:signal transduction histidine kinase